MIADITMARSFLAVMEEGSVVAGARSLGYSASAVSRQLAMLQRRLGVRLFVPDGRSIRPTENARELVDHCRDLVAEAHRFESYAGRIAADAVREGAAR